ncbi:NUDIX hydrolase [Candidatus Poseidoniaceae archaeon]|nr:NUDIX hydrolase [Candidatus Poseidoniaceae archaeon]MDA8546754.1 NUDIX hydrolase [Euryarchaeota archaeon]MDA8567976.1 NUDIX hydrolase [Euryarchaeota archaeon]MDA8610114.1 NUDIX hydrolase [Euryarchaeota archaeon]MDA8728132.1 NUDIX hydrolase [Euryarchaeota archaeon]
MSPKNEPVFVLAWVTTRAEKRFALGNGGRVLFVEHPERGWEIPGGHVEFEETPDDALLRELYEETGLKGTVLRWNTTYYPKGWVAHVVVEDTELLEWNVHDENVSNVKWWSEVPPLKEWTVEEFIDLSEWCCGEH